MLMMREQHGYIRSIDIANELNVTKPSVSYATKRLRLNGYITMDKDGLITLTDSGMAIATRIYERHKTLTSFFMHLGIDEETALAIGYYAEKYAQSLIENKDVRYKKLDNSNIQITINGKNYNNLIKNSPFALENSKPVNEKLFEKQVNLAKSSKLRIFNNKSNKFHRLNCKYGQLAHDIAILPLSQIPKGAQECKFCKDVVKKESKTFAKSDINTAEKNIIKDIKPQKFLIASGDITLFLTDLCLSNFKIFDLIILLLLVIFIFSLFLTIKESFIILLLLFIGDLEGGLS